MAAKKLSLSKYRTAIKNQETALGRKINDQGTMIRQKLTARFAKRREEDQPDKVVYRKQYVDLLLELNEMIYIIKTMCWFFPLVILAAVIFVKFC